MNKITEQLPEMLSGQELIDALKVMPEYSEEIRYKDKATRLMALSELYNIYLPSDMSTEIYSKIYLSLLRSLQKKTGIKYIKQHNDNHKIIMQKEYNSIIGGSDSFTIIGTSGVGKSTAINRAANLISINGIIETKNPYSKIIPCLVVQCPFDASVKGLLLEILRKVDDIIGSDYYIKGTKARVTTDMLIGCVSQIALNHIGLLIVDEIQNVVENKNGRNLVGALTQLINNSGISINMVGTPKCQEFFENEMQLARRSLGLQYSQLPYNQYFYNFCSTVFSYQYIKNKTEITDDIAYWLYERSGGIISVVISLIHDAQEISILNDTEILNLETLNESYKKRLSMLHTFIEPTINRKKQTTTTIRPVLNLSKTYTTENNVSIAELAKKSKTENIDIITLLKKHITVEVAK